MKKFFYLLVPFLLFACGAEEDEGQVLESSGDESVDLENEPEVIQDFFSIPIEIISGNYCYNEEDLIDLIVRDHGPEFGWTMYEVKEDQNYLLAENDECMVTLEFVTFVQKGTKYAYLNQVDKNSQAFLFLVFNEENEEWEKTKPLPMPDFRDYFHHLSDEEIGIVEANGYHYLYLSTEDEIKLTWVFSDWEFGRNLDAEGIEFEKMPDFEFELIFDNGDHTLQKIGDEELISNKYFVAYFYDREVSEDWNWFFYDIDEALSPHGVESNMFYVEDENYLVEFEKDSFDISTMIEPDGTSGYLFYEPGKDPLSLPYDMPEGTIAQAMEYFGISSK